MSCPLWYGLLCFTIVITHWFCMSLAEVNADFKDLPYFSLDGECGVTPQRVGGQMMRISGGKPAESNKWPWLVFFKGSSSETCAGTLIHRRYVLTAAHCRLMAMRLREFSVRVGEHRIYEDDGTEFESKIKRITIHPHHDTDLYVSKDIALLELSQPVPIGEHVQVACLPKKNSSLPTGTLMTLVGWGYMNASNYKPGILQELTLPIVDREDCERRYLPYLNNTLVDEIMNKSFNAAMRSDLLKRWYDKLATFPPLDYICLASNNKKDSCKGDSGGPVMHHDGKRWVVHAFVVGGPGACGESWLPSINTDISMYVDWIVDTVRKGELRLKDEASTATSTSSGAHRQLFSISTLLAVVYAAFAFAFVLRSASC